MSLSNKQPNSTKQPQCTYHVHTGRMHERIVFTKQVRQFKVRSTRVCVSIHLWWREEGKYSESLRQDLQINYLLHPNWIFGSTVRRESIRIFRVQVVHCCSTKPIRKPDSPPTKTLSQLSKNGILGSTIPASQHRVNSPHTNDQPTVKPVGKLQSFQEWDHQINHPG